jgi:hypothetical protein
MKLNTKLPLKCAKCKGLKYVGEPYYAFGHWYVDVTCLICSDSKDFEVNELKELLSKLEKALYSKKRD